jgi:hypothetical protein
MRHCAAQCSAWRPTPGRSRQELAQTGTRALIGAAFATPAEGEPAWAERLLPLLDETMLLLIDRGFDAGAFLAKVAATCRITAITSTITDTGA